MIIDSVITKLDESPALLQVVRADSFGGGVVDTADLLDQLLKSTVSDRMYPYHLPDNPTHPSIVSQKVASKPRYFDGFPVLSTDAFVLTIRCETLAELINLHSTVRGLIDGYQVADAAGAIEITDMALDYEPDQGTYRADIELLVTHINAAYQAAPLAGVYLVQSNAAASEHDGFIAQQVRSEVAVILLVPSAELETIKDSVFAGLLGHQINTNLFPFSYVSGDRLDVFGHLVLWREIYQTAQLRRQT